MSGRQLMLSFVLPMTIFPVLLGLGCKYMYAEHTAAGMDDAIKALCLSASSPSFTFLPFIFPSSKTYLRFYIFIPSIDRNDPGICDLVAFFHLILDSPFPIPRRFLAYLLWTGLPCILVPLIEAYRYRGKQHWLLRYPTFWLLIAQIYTVGITYTIYWPLLIISRARSSESEETSERNDSVASSSQKPREGKEEIAKQIEPVQVEGLIFGLAIGAVLPSVALVVLKDPFATWVWQFYPIYVALVRAAYVLFSASATDKEKKTNQKVKLQSQKALRALYIACFLIASITHIYFVWPLFRKSDWRTMVDLLIPERASRGAHPSRQTHNFLKWDYALGYGSLSVALLWSARNFGQVVRMLLWYAIAIPAIGMGGAVMGILAWRDL